MDQRSLESNIVICYYQKEEECKPEEVNLSYSYDESELIGSIGRIEVICLYFRSQSMYLRIEADEFRNSQKRGMILD